MNVTKSLMTSRKRITPMMRFTLGMWLMNVQIMWAVCAIEPLLVAANESTKGPQHFRRTPDNLTAKVGDRVTLACSVENKVGLVQWTMDGFGLGTDRDLEGYERYSMNISENERDYNLEIYPVTLEDDALFQCQVSPGADGGRELRSAKAKLTVEVLNLSPEIIHGDLFTTTEVVNTDIRLEVRYAPKVSVKIQSAAIYEFDDVRISCRTEANPSDMSLRWLLNDQVVPGVYGKELLLSNVTRKYHGVVVKCEVQNVVGKSQDNETLFIIYGPVFRNRPQNVQADLGTSVTLRCEVDGNPPPIISWIDETNGAVIHEEVNFTTILSEDTQGGYICQAHVQGFPPISADATIHIKGPPHILSQSVQFGVEGDTVRLECLVKSIPPSTKITWAHLGRVIRSNSDYAILEDSMPTGNRSVLVIRSSQEEDFGPYNCTVTNTYGSHIMEIFLVKQKSSQLTIILPCVIGGVVVIVALIVLTILCQRRTQKLALMEIDGDENYHHIPNHHTPSSSNNITQYYRHTDEHIKR